MILNIYLTHKITQLDDTTLIKHEIDMQGDTRIQNYISIVMKNGLYHKIENKTYYIPSSSIECILYQEFVNKI